jgi:regulator of sigma E protease
MDTLIIIFQLLTSLSILVLLHEGGHFLAAKVFKTKVEKFYLFFNPWFSIFKFRRGETEYGIGWLPFGGYVKIAGMIDESFDKEQLQGEVQPWEFRAKPAWQRLIIMLGGIIVNVMLGIVIFIFIVWMFGTSYIKSDSVSEGIYVDSLGYEMGLRDGDKILQIGDVDFVKFDRGVLVKEVVINQANTIKVERENNIQTLDIDPKFIGELSKHDNKDMIIFGPRIPFEISEISDGSPADAAGIQLGDRIIEVNNKPSNYAHEVRALLAGNVNSSIHLKVVRQQKDTLAFDAVIGEDGMLGVYPSPLSAYFEIFTEKYSFGQAIPLGVQKSYQFIADQVKAFGMIFSGKIKAKDSLGSVISIGKMFGTEWDWLRFWNITAMLSLLLAFLNLLPIPGLDGGHVLFVLWEMITGKKPSDKFLEYATMVGFILLIGLMIFALGLDILRLF